VPVFFILMPVILICRKEHKGRKHSYASCLCVGKLKGDGF